MKQIMLILSLCFTSNLHVMPSKKKPESLVLMLATYSMFAEFDGTSQQHIIFDSLFFDSLLYDKKPVKNHTLLKPSKKSEFKNMKPKKTKKSFHN
jgi:hypothetical protein